MPSVLFYDDAAEFGGHQVMTTEAARCLAAKEDVTVSFVFCKENLRLARTLAAMNNGSRDIQLYPTKFRSGRMQSLRTLTSHAKITGIATLMRKVNPDVIVVSQGRIESSSMGLMAAKRVGVYTISYIPMAHSVRIAGNPFLTAFRDSINRHFYSLPDRIITISERARRMLIERGATPNIVVVPNGVESRGIQQSDRQRFREAFKIEKKQLVVTILGRISFKQKGQDFAVRAISRFRSELENFQFLIVGSGPDAPRLKGMISELDLNPQVQVLPWEDDPKAIYAGTDMLLIPSRFEGVPLVMLEAMSAGLPIVATNVDVMPELLPKDWLFPYGDCRALIDTLRCVARRDNSQILELHKRRVATEFTMASFRSKFINAVLGELRPTCG